jgi:hypothetical protein
LELYRYPVFKSSITPVTICPLGDIQWAGDEADLAYDRLALHLKDCLSRPTPLFVGMGDYIDFASPSNRERLTDAKLYDTAKRVIADASKGLVDDLYRRLLKPTEGKWLGLTQGHHHHPVLLGKSKSNEDLTMDSDVYLAGLLKAKWLDEFGFVRLTWPGGGVFHVVVYHGKGSSVFPWGPLNQLWRLVPNFHADLLLMGHQTKKAMAETDRLMFPETGDKVRHMTVKIVGTGGWTKGYIPGRRTYISEAGLSPVALGQPMVHLRPHVVDGRWDVGMTVEL